ncbi:MULTISPECIES: hypothetical protein [unclassified Pedobacter]|uniref:hypothetical protein n=1 Tax=unclassified Pedobacter TaxID=2628915 RepID=UPI001E38C05C|nr:MULTISPECIES: hypothetical protein [unclassified Pedobacter]
MKKFLHILLLGFYLFSTTELQEIAKVPVLFQHFFEHKGLDSNVTFLGYLEHHYSNIPHTDNDEERDNQLPFKNHNFCTANFLSPALPTSSGITFKKVYQVIPQLKVILNNDILLYSAYAGKIWQPPKSSILS